MKLGVYRIRNIVNEHCYIGSTIRSFNQRKAEHFKNLRKNIHSSPILQNAWNRYGENNLIFEILEKCSKEKCLEREQYYLDAFKPAYNINKNAENSAGRKWNENQRKKCLSKKGRESFFFSNEFFKFRNIISGEDTILPRFEFAKKYSIDPSYISKLCNGKKKIAKNWICVEKSEVQNG